MTSTNGNPSRRTRDLARLAASVGLVAAILLPLSSHAATSRELLSCQKAVESQVRGFTNFAVARISNCTEKIVECKLAQEIDATDPTACLASAAAACATVPQKVADQQTIRAGKIALKCGLFPLADLEPFVAGLGFFNLVSDCGAADATDLAMCVLDAGLCPASSDGARGSLERAIFRLDPRAQDSLSDPAINLAASFPCVAP
jgi:hypothetical protein